jgi:hypothetical protein
MPVRFRRNPQVGTVNYSYDANGNLSGLWSATANGVSNTYQYDALHRLTHPAKLPQSEAKLEKSPASQ